MISDGDGGKIQHTAETAAGQREIPSTTTAAGSCWQPGSVLMGYFEFKLTNKIKDRNDW